MPLSTYTLLLAILLSSAATTALCLAVFLIWRARHEDFWRGRYLIERDNHEKTRDQKLDAQIEVVQLQAQREAMTHLAEKRGRELAVLNAEEFGRALQREAS